MGSQQKQQRDTREDKLGCKVPRPVAGMPVWSTGVFGPRGAWPGSRVVPLTAPKTEVEGIETSRGLVAISASHAWGHAWRGQKRAVVPEGATGLETISARWNNATAPTYEAYKQAPTIMLLGHSM